MAAPVTIALDAMGGDHGPGVIIAGASISLVRHPDTRFLLVGDGHRIEAELKSHAALATKAEILHTDVAVAMDAKPSQALRKGRRHSSMWLSLEAVRDGRADAAVSAGNTGALMAMAKFCLKTIPGIDRPAIAVQWPTVESECIVLDVGANVGADARQLVEFALMGAAMARALFGMERPTVGLLNIGVEEVKGLDEIKAAATALKDTPLPIEFRGFVEGDEIGHGAADVVVTDGFTGNIALKTAEGTAKQIGEYFRAAMGGARHVIDEERLFGSDLLELLHVLDGLIGHRRLQIPAGIVEERIDRRGVAEQVRLPLAGIAPDEAVEIFEAHSIRPLIEWPCLA